VTDQARITTEAARIEPLASTALERYDLTVRKIDHLATHSNVLYRVVTDDGRQMVLRVGTPDANSPSNVGYEVAWLEALNRETSLDVVTPIPTAGGRMVTEVADPDSGETRQCVLFTWVPGAPLGEGAGPFSYRLLGQMSAQLQAHGLYWRPDDLTHLRRWSRVFYYAEDLDPVVLFEGKYDHVIGTGYRSKIMKALPRAEKTVKATWESDRPQIVHGDLHEWNAHIVGTRLYAFDFEDVMAATPAQDVSVSLYSSRAAAYKEEVRAAFRAGFEEYGAWPIQSEEQLDGLHAARQIMLMNYAIRVLPESEAVEYLDKVMPWMDDFVARYG
jgi:Ser/Thr protein kinase RdoA (MazF antagonist)